jgi:hypothetical protein
MNVDWTNSDLSFVESFAAGTWVNDGHVIPEDYSSGVVSAAFTESFATGTWVDDGHVIPEDYSSPDAAFTESFAAGTWVDDAYIIPENFSTYSNIYTDSMDWSIASSPLPLLEINTMAKRLYLKAPAGGGDVLISDLGLLIPVAETNGLLVSCSDEESLDAAAGERLLVSSSEVRNSKTLLALLQNGTLLMKRAAADSFDTSANLAEPFAPEELMTADLADQQVVMAELEVVTSIKANSVETDSVSLLGNDLSSTLTGHAGRLSSEEGLSAAAVTDRALIRSDQVAADAAAKTASDLYSDQSEADAESAADVASAARVLAESQRAVLAEDANEAKLATLNHASAAGSVAKAVQDEEDRAISAAATEKAVREGAEDANATSAATNAANIQAGAELFFYPNGVSDYKALLTSLGASVGSGSLIDNVDDNKTAGDSLLAAIGNASTANTVKGDIKDLEDADAVITADVDVLEVAKALHAGRLTTAEADITALESGASTSVTTVSNLSAANAGLTGVVSTHNVITLANQSGLSAEVTNRANADGVLQGNIDDVDTRVDNIMHLTTDPSLDSLKEIVDAFQTSDASTAGTLLLIQADINQNETDSDDGIAAVQADVNQNESDSDAAIAALAADVNQNETDADAASLAAQTKANANEADIAALEGDQIAISVGASEPYLAALYAGLGATSAKDYIELNASGLAAGGNAFIGAGGIATYLATFNGGNAAPAGSAFGQIEQNKSDVAALVADVAQNESDSDSGIAAAAASASLVARNSIQADVDANEASADASIAALVADVAQNESDADSSIAALVADVAQNESDSDAADSAAATANQSARDAIAATATANAATAAAAVTAAEAAAASALAAEKAVQDSARAALVLENKSQSFGEDGWVSYMHLKSAGSAIPSNTNSARFNAAHTVKSYAIGLAAQASAASEIKIKLIDDAGAVKSEEAIAVPQGSSYVGGNLASAMAAVAGDRLAVEVSSGLVSSPIVTVDFSKDV